MPFAPLAYIFLARAEDFLDTIFPDLLFISMALLRPLLVFSFEPRKTTARASLPLAMTLTLFFFMLRMDFIDFIDFIAFIDFMLRMAFIDLIDFITRA